jgi:hypothetical protein
MCVTFCKAVRRAEIVEKKYRNKEKEMCVTICIAVRRVEIVRKMTQEQRESKRCV